MEVVIIDTIAVGIITKIIPQLLLSASVINTILTKINGQIFNDYGATSAINAIRTLDLNNNIKILTLLITDITPTNTSVAISNMLSSILECIQLIESQLTIIHDRISYNKTLWLFRSVRAFGFTNRIIEITALSEILNKRQQLLFNLLSIQHK